MTFRLLIITTASLLIGAGCRDKTTIRPPRPTVVITSPTPTAPVNSTVASTTTAPASAYHPIYGVLDSLKLALIAYNGVRPLDRRTGSPLPIYPSQIIGGSNDTIYFNGALWSHRPELRKQIHLMRHPDDGENVTDLRLINVGYYFANPNNRDDIEGFTFAAPNAVGRYRTADITRFYTSYFLAGSDYLVDGYVLDASLDNWIEITKTDVQKRQVSGRFDLYLKMPGDGMKRSPVYSPIVLPNTIHMHGSFNY